MASYRIPIYLSNFYSQSPEEQQLHLEKALSEHPEDSEVLRLMKAISLCFRKVTQQRGLELFAEITKTAPDREHIAFAYWQLSKIYYLEIGDLKTALEYGFKYFEMEADNCEAMIHLAEIYESMKQWDNSLMWAEKALQDHSCINLAYEQITRIRVMKEEYDQAIETARLGLGLNPQSVDLLLQLGIAYAGKEEYDLAKQAFSEILSIDAKHTRALYLMGLCWQNQDDFYRAMGFYTKALQIKPGMPEVYNNIGKLYYDHDGDYRRAIEYFEKAIAESPDPTGASLAHIYSNLSKIYRQMLEEEKSNYYLKKYFACTGVEPLFDLLGLDTGEYGEDYDNDDENEDDDE